MERSKINSLEDLYAERQYLQGRVDELESYLKEDVAELNHRLRPIVSILNVVRSKNLPNIIEKIIPLVPLAGGIMRGNKFVWGIAATLLTETLMSNKSIPEKGKNLVLSLLNKIKGR